MIDLQAIRARAAQRLAATQPPPPANLASRLIPAISVSQLAALASAQHPHTTPDLSDKAAGAPPTCADCNHRQRAGNCGEPEAAALFPRGHGFGLTWAPAGYAASCTARSPTSPAKADRRPYRLSAAEGDAPHAVAWDRTAIARFAARETRLVRLGFDADDAADLAEGAHLRDVTADERVACWQCAYLRHWHCRQHQRAGLSAPVISRDLAVLPQRCPAAEVRI